VVDANRVRAWGCAGASIAFSETYPWLRHLDSVLFSTGSHFKLDTERYHPSVGAARVNTPQTNNNDYVDSPSYSSQYRMACNAMEDSLSAYDSIIPKGRNQWEKLDDNTTLAQLHRKFWPQGKPENKLLNIRDDAGDDEADDDEIGPDCYIFDAEIPDLKRSTLWIRKEYIRLYKCCNEFLEKHRNNEEPPSVVITGQPGIGKCRTF
jgi:hypothetical protein